MKLHIGLWNLTLLLLQCFYLATCVNFKVWFVRISLLVKLRMFSSAEAELNAFHDFEAPDLYYQFYPDVYPGKKGKTIK